MTQHILLGAFSSPIVASGLVLMVSGAVMALCRKVPESFLTWIQRQCLLEISILGDDPLFDWTRQWLGYQKYAMRARVLSASTKSADQRFFWSDISEKEKGVALSPGPGHHFFIYRKHLIWLARNRSQAQGGTYSAMWHEDMNIRILGRNSDLARQLMDDIKEIGGKKPGGQITIYSSNSSDWKRMMETMARPQESVVLPVGIFDDLKDDAEKFFLEENWYRQKGIPYRRGYLLHGIAGAGKTSTVMALAVSLGLNIYIVNLMDQKLGDAELATLLCDIPAKKSLVLLEDVDSAFIGRSNDENSDKPRLTFSGLLNALDGAMAAEGRILVMTTNHIEKLDEALIRPGRIDKRVEFCYANREQCAGIYRRFFPKSEEKQANAFALSMEGTEVSMAVLQSHLYLYRHDPDGAMANSYRILEEQERQAQAVAQAQLKVVNHSATAQPKTLPASDKS